MRTLSQFASDGNERNHERRQRPSGAWPQPNQNYSHGWRGNTTDKVAKQTHLENSIVIHGIATPSVGTILFRVQRLKGKKSGAKNGSSKSCTTISQTTIFGPLILCLSLGCGRRPGWVFRVFRGHPFSSSSHSLHSWTYVAELQH